MPTIFKIQHKDIVGDNYEILLQAALLCFDSFSLYWRTEEPYTASRHAIGNKLRHHQITKQEGKILYRFDADALPILLLPGSLFQWRSPNYPEDLTFYRDQREGFASISHEKTAWIVDLDFARSLPQNLGFAEEIVSEKVHKNHFNVTWSPP